MPKIKNLIIITVSSFFFLLLIAILAGNSLFSAIFKAFFSSLVFSCIIAIAEIVLKKMIPELSNLGSDIDTKADGHLDIVLDEENPHQATDNDSNEETTVAFDSEDEEDFSKKEFVEEVEEESIGDISALAPEIGDEIIEVMTEDEVDDELPVIDTSEILSNGSNLGNRSRSVYGKRNETANSLKIDADPSTMAKAIKTVMKRDEK